MPIHKSFVYRFDLKNHITDIPSVFCAIGSAVESVKQTTKQESTTASA